MSAVYWVGGLPWIYPSALIVCGLTGGVWLDWLLRKFDGSREAKRREIGRDMQSLARTIQNRQNGYHGEWPQNAHDLRAAVMSVFIKAEQIGIWAPTEQPYEMGETGLNILVNYLRIVGTMLADGHFPQAGARALQLKQALDTGAFDAARS